MNSTFYHLEFYKIIELIKNECHSQFSKELIEQLIPLDNKEEIVKRLSFNDELQQIIRRGIGYSFEGLSDLKILLIEWIYQNYNFEEFKQIVSVIQIANSISRDHEAFEDYPLFLRIVKRIYSFEYIEKRFLEIFTPDGDVLDSASKELAQIRRRKKQIRERIISTLSKMNKDQKYENYIQDKIISHRDDRYVVLLKEGAVSFIDGISHGRSTSSSSVYFEPKEVVGMNNELNQTDSDEKKEIFRILSEYSKVILESKNEIYQNCLILQRLDAGFAIGRFSNSIQASIPEIVEEPILELNRARHPLLITQFGDIRKVIPFDLNLGTETRILLISGPNTGGKTITLKTIGLLTLMALSGLPISANIGSKIGLFKKVFADIGDNQSIESYLSSFSAHIKNINEMLIDGDSESLILVDEIGAATDPEQGSALAQAILETFVDKGVVGVITTHYTALKIFAENSDSCVNASMQFDSTQHLPTYRFQYGLPGNSFAIEIASGLGVESHIIQRARDLSGNQNVELTDLLQKMNEEKKKLAVNNYQLELKTRLTEQKVSEYEKKIEQIEQDKKKILRDSLNDAKDFLIQMQKEYSSELDDIKKLNKEERKTRIDKEMTKIINLRDELSSKQQETSNPKERQRVKGNIEIGSIVWVKKIDTIATVVELSKDSAKVDMNGILFSIPMSNLILHSKDFKEEKVIFSSNAKSESISGKLEINVIGKIFDEALPMIESFLDQAMLSGMNRVRIVHGKGTGILRKKIRDYLRRNKKVIDFYSPAPEAGGDGVTVVSFS